jgi:NAD+ kinase
MRVAIHGLSLKAEFLPILWGLFEKLQSLGVSICLTPILDQQLRLLSPSSPAYQILLHPEDFDGLDFLLSIGGDGTLLDSVCVVGKKEIPILGLNTGRLGFLANVATDKIGEAIEELAKGNYQIESRILLSLNSSKKLFHGVNFALNEFTIHKKDTSSMITVHTFIDGKYLNSYWADGLIVATPTGSTGYSLSCGGPLITPGAKNFVITPVSPHNLNVRPIIVSDEAEISFEIEGRTDKFFRL